MEGDREDLCDQSMNRPVAQVGGNLLYRRLAVGMAGKRCPLRMLSANETKTADERR
jgi:hypothetical protein